jgi:hypothetical protein
MLLTSNKPLINAIVIYLLIVFVIIYLKPAIFFDSNHGLKNYGLDISKGKTLFPLPVMLIVIAIFTYLISIVLSNDI